MMLCSVGSLVVGKYQWVWSVIIRQRKLMIVRCDSKHNNSTSHAPNTSIGSKSARPKTKRSSSSMLEFLEHLQITFHFK